MSDHRCASCGSTAVNPWTSWKVAGDWTCNECTPPSVDGEDE